MRFTDPASALRFARTLHDWPRPRGTVMTVVLSVDRLPFLLVAELAVRGGSGRVIFPGPMGRDEAYELLHAAADAIGRLAVASSLCN